MTAAIASGGTVTSGGTAASLAAARAPAPDMLAFHLHPVAVAVVAVLVVAWRVAIARWSGDSPPTRRQQALGVAGVIALLASVTWPVADLAARWSLVALVGQRLLLTLAAAPLLLAATPATVIGAATRPRPVDHVVERVTQPVVAVLVFTAVAVGTLVPPAVAAQATSSAARGGFDAALLVGGVVLWAPVLRNVVGASRPGPLGMAVYLVVQSLVPTFLSLVFVFARHPLYPVFAHAGGAIGVSPLADQQIAGIVGKVGTIPVLWWVAWWELSRGRRLVDEGRDPEALMWLDVQRQLERAERRSGRPRTVRRAATRSSLRPTLTTSFPTVEPPAPDPAPDPDPGPPATGQRARTGGDAGPAGGARGGGEGGGDADGRAGERSPDARRRDGGPA